MPRQLVPVTIKPYLIPFLYQHFKGETARINNKRVKSVIIDTRTPFGKMIRFLAKNRTTKKACDTTHSFFFSLREQQSNREYFGNIYKYQDGRSSLLEFDQEAIDFINEELEDHLLNSMMFFLLGWHHKEGEAGLSKGIQQFCVKYELFEYGYDVAAIRRRFYRWLDKTDNLFPAG